MKIISRRGFSKLLAVVIALLLAVPLSACDPTPKPIPTGSLEVLFIDVGQADAALITCDGKYLLIDGGNKGDSQKIYTILSNRGIDYLDYIVFSHTDEDHVGGLAAAVKQAKVGTCYGPSNIRDTNAFNDFKRILEEQGKSITIPKDEVVFGLGSATVTATHVTTNVKDPNEDELVVRIVFGETSFLFTGDIGKETESAYMDLMGYDIESTVLKVPHHGSSTSSSYSFLRAVNPAYSVISVGAGNSYGHPKEDVLSRYHDQGCELFRTDLQGDITATSDGQTVKVQTQRKTSVDIYSPGKE